MKKTFKEIIFLKNINFVLLPNFLKLILNIIILTPLITFYLNVEELGIIALITAAIIFLFSVFNFRTDWILNKNFKILNKKKELLFNIYLYDLLIKLFLTILFGIIFYCILKFNIFLFKIDYQYCVFLSFITNIFLSINLTSYAFFHLNKNFKVIFYIEFIKIFSNLFFVFILLEYFSLGIIAVFLGLALSSVIGFFIELTIVKKFLNFKINISLLKSFYKFSKSVIYLNISGTAIELIERFFILKLISLFTVGIFFHAKTYMYFAFNIVKGTLKTILSDFLKAIKNKNKANLTKIEKIFFNINLLFFLSSILISLFIYDFINLLTHGKLVEAAKYVPFLFLITQTSLNYFIVENYLILQNKVKLLSLTVTYSNIFLIVLLPFFLYFFNLWGLVALYGLQRLLFILYIQNKIKNYYFVKFNINFYLTFFSSLLVLVLLNIFTLNNFLFYSLALFLIIIIIITLKNFIRSLKTVL